MARPIQRLPWQPPAGTITAEQTFSYPQIFIGFLLFGILGIGFYLDTLATLVVLMALINIGLYLPHALFQVWQSVVSMQSGTELTVADWQSDSLIDGELPRVTALIPLYHEPPEVIRQLVRHLSLLDYPIGRFQAVVLLEEDDERTQV